MISRRSLPLLFACGLLLLAPSLWAQAAFDEKPVPVKTPPPKFPPQMKSEGIDGTVAVRVVIGVEGDVKSAEVAKSSRSEFEQPALDAVQKWKFKPAKKAGEAVECKIVIPIRFSLD